MFRITKKICMLLILVMGLTLLAACTDNSPAPMSPYHSPTSTEELTKAQERLQTWLDVNPFDEPVVIKDDLTRENDSGFEFVLYQSDEEFERIRVVKANGALLQAKPDGNFISIDGWYKTLTGRQTIPNAKTDDDDKQFQLDKMVSYENVSINIPSQWEYNLEEAGGYISFEIYCTNKDIKMSVFESRSTADDVRSYNLADSYNINTYTFADGSKGKRADDGAKTLVTYENEYYEVHYLIDYATAPNWYNQNKELIDAVAKTLTYKVAPTPSEPPVSTPASTSADSLPGTDKVVWQTTPTLVRNQWGAFDLVGVLKNVSDDMIGQLAMDVAFYDADGKVIMQGSYNDRTWAVVQLKYGETRKISLEGVSRKAVSYKILRVRTSN